MNIECKFKLLPQCEGLSHKIKEKITLYVELLFAQLVMINLFSFIQTQVSCQRQMEIRLEP